MHAGEARTQTIWKRNRRSCGGCVCVLHFSALCLSWCCNLFALKSCAGHSGRYGEHSCELIAHHTFHSKLGAWMDIRLRQRQWRLHPAAQQSGFLNFGAGFPSLAAAITSCCPSAFVFDLYGDFSSHCSTGPHSAAITSCCVLLAMAFAIASFRFVSLGCINNSAAPG